MSEPRLVVVGAAGRMGRRLVALAAEAGLTVAGQIEQSGPDLRALDPGEVDVVVDFSVLAQLQRTLSYCEAHSLPLVTGITGLEAAEHAALDRLGQHVPVVWAANFSVGVNALFALVAEAARMLGDDFDIEIVEAHHRRKVDAPSGTARELARRVAGARGWELDAVARYGRHGQIGARPADELGIAAIRGGSVVGEHDVLYLGEGETLSLSHRAADRDIFVRGALRAARWAAETGRAPGRYDMGDVLRKPTTKP